MRVRITQIDGSLPNLALMKLSAWHKSRGDTVVFSRETRPSADELSYDGVYASSIFKFSAAKTERLLETWPDAIIGGTGVSSERTVEEITGQNFTALDYDLYPEFEASIGFTQRGCRFKCAFCVVPRKEGAPISTGSLSDIWRGPGYAKKLHLLDNDFFGQPKAQWKALLEEAREKSFRLCFSQGINVRVITEEIADELSRTQYRDNAFGQRRLYTAWDNLGDERLFFRGVDRLEAAGVPPKHLMAYMLVGFDPSETWDAIWHRFNKMIDRGIRPYPMVFDCRDKEPDRYRALKKFQRWVVTGLYRAVPFDQYDASKKKLKFSPGEIFIRHVLEINC